MRIEAHVLHVAFTDSTGGGGAPHYHWAVVKVQAPHSVSTDTAEGWLRRGAMSPLGNGRSLNFPLGPFWCCLCRDSGERFITLFWGEVRVQVSLVFSTDTTAGVEVVREPFLFTTGQSRQSGSQPQASEYREYWGGMLDRFLSSSQRVARAIDVNTVK